MENYSIEKKKEDEPKWKSILREIKTFLKRHWKELLIMALVLTSVEILYSDYPPHKLNNQSGGMGAGEAVKGFFKATGSEAKSGAGAIIKSPLTLGKGVFKGMKKLPSAGKAILNTNLPTKILSGIWLLLKNLMTLLLLVFIFMAIPLVPILIFMLIMFFILRGQVGNLKQI